MSTRTAVMVAVALTAALVLAGVALAVVLTRDDGPATVKVDTCGPQGSAYFVC